MRFFKAFNLLHRRSKSATFVPGPNGSQLDFATSQVTPSSLPLGRRHKVNTGGAASLFDLVTSKCVSAPSNFSHLNAEEPNHHPNSNRGSRTDSSASTQLVTEEDYERLRRTLTMWIHEHSKVQSLLRKCQVDLMAERQKTQVLEHQTRRDKEHIMDLRNEVTYYEIQLGTSSNTNYLGHGSCPARAVHGTIATLAPASLDSCTPFKLSSTLRTLDEYASALRLTLATRGQLRDQKKISKFWKEKATDSGTCPDVITPSTSAMSSVHETLSIERKAAVDALIAKRGGLHLVHTHSQKSLSTPTIPSVLSILSSTSSRSSGISRLGPLASESLKAEMNVLFGAQSYARKLSIEKKRWRSGSLNAALSSGSLAQMHPFREQITDHPSLSLESYRDLTLIFADPVNINLSPKVKLPALSSSRMASQQSELALQGLSLASSNLAESAIPSGYSESFAQMAALSITEEWKNAINVPVSDSPQSLKISSVAHASSECTPRRSWQRYMTKSFSTNEPNGDKGQSLTKMSAPTSRKVAKGKENAVSSMTLPSLKRRPSRLPVPAFMKEWS